MASFFEWSLFRVVLAQNMLWFFISFKKNTMNFLKGMVMGVAEIIPGVSGSTMALIMGIYDDFIGLIHDSSSLGKNVLLWTLKKKTTIDVKESFAQIKLKFGITLALGMLFAIALFSNIFSFLLEHHPDYLYAFLFGLIIASIYVPYKQMKKRETGEVTVFLVTFVVMFIILGQDPSSDNYSPSLALLLIGGITAASAMALPGVSGSFVLLLLGLYHHVLDLVKEITRLNFSTDHLLQLTTFLTGVLIGLVGISRVIKAAFNKYPSQTLAFLLGLMAASLRVINPFQSTLSENTLIEIIIKIILILIGMGIVIAMLKHSGSELENMKSEI